MLSEQEYFDILNDIEDLKIYLREAEQRIIDDRDVDMLLFRDSVKELSRLRILRDQYEGKL